MLWTGEAGGETDAFDVLQPFPQSRCHDGQNRRSSASKNKDRHRDYVWRL